MTLLLRAALVCFALVALAWLGSAPAGEAEAPRSASVEATAPADAVLSIYDDELRRFRFRVDYAVVTTEEAYAFTQRYESPENPPILGAMPDNEDPHVLVVVGPPEAEQAIRRVLAKIQLELHGLLDPSIEIQKRALVAERRSLIADVAALEIARIGIDDEAPEDRSRIADLDARLQAFEREIAIVEQKLAVADRNLERLRAEP